MKGHDHTVGQKSHQRHVQLGIIRVGFKKGLVDDKMIVTEMLIYGPNKMSHYEIQIQRLITTKSRHPYYT